MKLPARSTLNSQTDYIAGRSELEKNTPVVGTIPALIILSALLCLASTLASQRYSWTPYIVLSAMGLWIVTTVLIVRGLRSYPFSIFGWANTITALRASSTAFIAGLIPVAQLMQGSPTTSSMLLLFCLTLITIALDGLDGYLARRSGLVSAFGARFDMEIDALLALVIALFVWQSGKVGVWVLALGLMRYLFIIASFAQVALQAELFPSLRRKVVCVIQLLALCALLCPWVQAPGTLLIGGFAVICLLASFAWDVIWLLQRSTLPE